MWIKKHVFHSLGMHFSILNSGLKFTKKINLLGYVFFLCLSFQTKFLKIFWKIKTLESFSYYFFLSLSLSQGLSRVNNQVLVICFS